MGVDQGLRNGNCYIPDCDSLALRSSNFRKEAWRSMEMSFWPVLWPGAKPDTAPTHLWSSMVTT
jgi:hypothetical protein